MGKFSKWRRVAVLALAGGIAAGFGGHAWSHGGHRGHDRGAMMDPAKMDQRIESMVKRMLDRVDATEAQRTKVTAIAKQAVSDLRGLRGRQQELRGKGIELLGAPTVDRNAIEALRAEQMKLADEASRRFSAALADTAEVLTPEQRAKLAQRMKERRSHHGRG